MKALLGDALARILIRVSECILGWITSGNRRFMAFSISTTDNYASELCSRALLLRSPDKTCGFLCAMTFLPMLIPSLSSRFICKFELDYLLYCIFEELPGKIVVLHCRSLVLLRFS